MILPHDAPGGAWSHCRCFIMFGYTAIGHLGAHAGDDGGVRQRQIAHAAVAAADSVGGAAASASSPWPSRRWSGIGYEPLAAGLGGNYGAELMPVLAARQDRGSDSDVLLPVGRWSDQRQRSMSAR